MVAFEHSCGPLRFECQNLLRSFSDVLLIHEPNQVVLVIKLLWSLTSSKLKALCWTYMYITLGIPPNLRSKPFTLKVIG